MTVPRGPDLALDRLTVGGRGGTVVDGVSLSIRPGEFVGLAGETGSGKTTTGLAALGFVRPGLTLKSGTARIGTAEMLGPGDDVLRRHRGRLVAYVPQDPATALNPGLRVGDLFRELFRAHGLADPAERESRVAGLFGALDLPIGKEFRRRFPHQLSGGQQQRVAVAAAFALRPAVVVMDEPTTGLDVLTRVQLLALLRALGRSEGCSVLFISHDLPLLIANADRIVILYAGRIVEDAPARRLAVSPGHPYTQALLAALPDRGGEGAPEPLPGRGPAPAERGHGCDFAPRCRFAVSACAAELPTLVAVAGQAWVRCSRLDAVGDAPAPTPVAAPRSARARATGDLLEVSRLAAQHGAALVTRGLALRLAAGECLAMVGESGSGKTTAARCIAGLHSRYSGTVLFEGRVLPRSVERRAQDDRRAIQYVFQNPYASLNPRRPVGRSIAMAATLLAGCSQTEALAKAAETMALVGLRPDHLSALPHALSGGERQRVALARALIAGPRLLICDEVTSSLDISVQAGIVALLQALQRERGLAMLFITHDLALAGAIADRAIVLKGGEAVEEGPVRELFAAPRHPYTRSLIAALG